MNTMYTMMHYSVDISKLQDYLQLSRDEIINRKKEIHRYGNNTFTAKKCLICGCQFRGKHPVSVCVSHSIPQFVLKALGSKYKNINSFIKSPASKEEEGLKQAGTFKLICTKCDGIKFQDYENPDIYTDSFSSNENLQLILNEISMKNYLYALYDHLKGKSSYQSLLQDILENGFDYRVKQILQDQIKVEEADINDNENGFEETKSILKRIRDKEKVMSYIIGYYHIFDRQFPIAIQSSIAPSDDCWVNSINNNFNLESSVDVMHSCVFPIKDKENNEKTIVLVFSLKKSTILEATYKKLNSLNPDSAAKAVLAMNIASSGNFYIRNDVSDSLFRNEYIKQLSGNTGTIITKTNFPTTSGEVRKNIINDQLSTARDLLSRYESIPNSLIGL